MRTRKSINIFEVFWQPLFITYVISSVILIFSMLIQFNIDEISMNFYRVKCDNNVGLLFFSKFAESLIPTTITFVITLLLSWYGCYDGKQTTACIILTFAMGAAEMLFPTMRDPLGLLFLNIFTYGIITASLLLIARGLSRRSPRKTAKNEKSDGSIQ